VLLFAVVGLARAPQAGAEDPATSGLSDTEILGKPAPYFRIEALNLRYTHFDQRGYGYQSRAGPVGGPGSEQMTIEQPQLELIAKQGDKITHRIWVPVDIVSAASPDAIDAVSTASRVNEAGTLDWTIAYKATPHTTVGLRTGVHGEENYRSWNFGFSIAHSFAEDNATLEIGVNQLADWFDKYKLNGGHNWHTARSASNANVGLTQLLSPTTIAHVDYGVTLQRGQLSNGWNIVPLDTGGIALEVLPRSRVRQAFSGRIAQALPWNGALHGSYRFYVDGWGIRAHTSEVELYQRISSFSYLRLNYRFHEQTAADFFTTRAPPNFELATADSDLASFVAQTIGIKGAFDLPVSFANKLHLDLAVERYFRTNDLRVNVYSCGVGMLF
jgi:hypothetical protein